jgi:hypothetical protein
MSLTAHQQSILDSISHSLTTHDDPDPFFGQGDEMYYNKKVKVKMKEKGKVNTFHHQVIENVLEATPLSSPPESPSAPFSDTTSLYPLEVSPLERSSIIGSGPKKGFKRISTNDKYVEINVQVTNFRGEGRFKRINVYVSLKTDTDSTYSVFLSGSGTTAKAELKRGAKDVQSVIDVITAFQNQIPEGMIARLHYKAPKGFVTDFHRGLLKSVMLCIDEQEGDFVAYLYLLGEYIEIPLNIPLTSSQKKHYIAAGLWTDTYNLTDEEEFDD